MNKRERNLAASVGALVLLVILAFTYRGVSGAFQARKLRESALQKEIDKRRRTAALGQALTQRMEVYERRSLPSDIEESGTLYQSWLLQTGTEVGLEDFSVNAVTSHGKEGIYHQFAFAVGARGDLRQLVRFLHRFYEVDYLHRIRRMHAKRVPDSRKLDVAFSVEALSLATATRDPELGLTPSNRLRQADLATYNERILSRNLMGTPNHPPEFGSLSPPKAYLQKPLSFSVSAKDADKWDKLTYSLESSKLSGATLDPKSGQFQWTPKEKGTFEVTFKVTDDGLPEKFSTKTVKFEVGDPPVVTETVKPPSFEKAQFAYVTGITQEGNRWLMWISLRADGKLLRVFEGEEFKVGEVTLKVLQIQDRSVELEARALKKRWIVGLGQNLAEGKPVEAGGT